MTGVGEQTTAREAELTKALEFYADPENYFAIAFWFDPPCGAFREDFSDADHLTEEPFGRAMPGKLARQVLGLERAAEGGVV